ncbi:EAL domain-containing protein [Caloramator sp. mosi_1]|uniref:EAL domain-containing protein n=1 Tax=Caloramator sp. mosi_1 TaxID=3023090 RepID=UPI002361287F|nr:EAL domain-containing protein [Caloramator sp. mosi_1]WDC84807.1 EAL domain-containing protein [Caloramator sp. mosi_1]
MVKFLIELFINLGYIVIAEGVETQHQFKILKEMGCIKIQGYYINKPIDAKEIEGILLQKMHF